MKDFKTNELPRENFIIFYLVWLGLLLLWPAYWIFTKLRPIKKKFRKMETIERRKTLLERIWQFCRNPVPLTLWQELEAFRIHRVSPLPRYVMSMEFLPTLSCVCIRFDGNFCHVLLCLVLLQVPKCFGLVQIFCARQKDDLHSVKLVFVPAQKFLKRH